MSRLTLPALAAAVALPLALSAGTAQAQMAQYCAGKVSANAFYANVHSNGSRSTVTYYAQLQNRSGEAIPLYRVTFTYPHATQRQNGSVGASLPPWQQVTVTLGQQSFGNPSGQGQLTPQQMAQYTQVVCAAH